VERPEVIEALKAARAQGDLSENADYDAARNRQAEIEARITEIEHIKDIAVIADEDRQSKKISLGNIVTYQEIATGETLKVKIVGTVEADPMAVPPLISNESALGTALIGQAVGAKVLVESELNPYEIAVQKIER
jgi:transcription elongation factor GreA